MIRHLLAAAALLAPVPALAQSQQDTLDARYDRALAAGYKALFLCSAIANAERAGAKRTPESVMEWELVGIQKPLDLIVPELEYAIERYPDGVLSYVEVQFAERDPSRYAIHDAEGGCSLRPIGYQPAAAVAESVTLAQASPALNAGTRKSANPERTFSLLVSEGDADQGRFVSKHPLDGPVEKAFSQAYGTGTRTTATLVRLNSVKDGLSEVARYAAGFELDVPQRTWSVAKSIAATLIGAAVQRDEADVQASAALGFANSDPRRAITIDHLLRMASGRYSDTPGNRTDQLYFGGSTVQETALHWPLVHAPGAVYRYANNDTLSAIKAIDDTFEDHPPARFFARVGMRDTVAETDWQGDYILSSQVWSTARDLATLGQLYLDDGVLPNGERILPENWVEYVSTPSGPQPEGEFGYGAGFWLFNKSEGVPADTIAMMGNRGQYVVIVPSRDVVIVRRGEDPVGARFDIAAFTRDVLSAMEN